MSKMDNLDRLYARKKFLKMVFPQLNEGEFYRIYLKTDDFSKVEFFNDIDEMNEYCDINRFTSNVYFSLSTTDGESGSEEHIKTRGVIAFDFDKKDYQEGLEANDIIFKFKEIGLWYHCLISSGNGYHAYICIEPTTDIEKVMQVTKTIGSKLGADINAMKSTQILRVPYTYNVKDMAHKKHVNIVFQFEKETIKRYNIDKLYNRFCSPSKNNNSLSDKATDFLLSHDDRIKPCVKEILERKAVKGTRNEDLQKIVVTLRRLNKSLTDIKYICKEWNNKNGFDPHTLDYQVEYMYNNLLRCSYECKNCKYSKECWNKAESDFQYSEDEEMINVEYKIAKKLKISKRVSVLEGNKLLVLNILKHWEKELSINDIINHLTYKGNCRLSEKTIRDALKLLENEKLIIKKNGIRKLSIPDTYKINNIKAKVEDIFNMSYFPTLICIYGIISPSELRLYTYMRYKHDLELKGEKAKGNIFRIDQEELANELGTSQPTISKMIKNLLDSKILEIWEIKRSYNGYDYYTYRLVK